MKQGTRLLISLAALTSACGSTPPASERTTHEALASEYIGCFVDRPDRALPAGFGHADSIADCTARVANAGYAYAGLEYYGECYGGNDVGYEQAPDSDCNTPCTGGDTCGGVWRNSIYRITDAQPPPPPCGVMQPNTALYHGQTFSSCDGRTYVDSEADLYHDGRGLFWDGRVDWYGTNYLAMQGDGNLVVYTSDNRPVWASGTWGHPGAVLRVQDDCNMVIYDGPYAIWASWTNCNSNWVTAR
jgi:hypothetical protein